LRTMSGVEGYVQSKCDGVRLCECSFCNVLSRYIMPAGETGGGGGGGVGGGGGAFAAFASSLPASSASSNPRESEFRKLKELGKGSFGVVHQVQRRSDNAEFALKEIDLVKAKMDIHSALKEVTAMNQLPPHKSIVRLHGHWASADGRVLWLLQDYCSRGNMFSVLSTARMPEAALLDLCRQLLVALEVFEQNHIVHNDINPDNIFITDAHEPKIGDFGLSRSTVHAPVGSVLASMPGCTPVYASPEVLSKLGFGFPEFVSSAVSYQSDVYSVGVVLWFLIMGFAPHAPGAASATPLTPANVNDGKLRSIVNEMLQVDPARRPRASALLKRI